MYVCYEQGFYRSQLEEVQWIGSETLYDLTSTYEVMKVHDVVCRLNASITTIWCIWMS